MLFYIKATFLKQQNVLFVCFVVVLFFLSNLIKGIQINSIPLIERAFSLINPELTAVYYRIAFFYSRNAII